MTLERAIRIEPRQAAVWLELARVRFDEGNYPQAGQLARKARSLASPQSSIAQQSAELIAESSERLGRPDLQ